MPWSDPVSSVAALSRQAAALPPGGVEVFWCAGAAVVGSGADELDAENAVLHEFLDQWQPSGGSSLFLTSSAGGVYAGSRDAPFTERSPTLPLAPYGYAKLHAEALCRAFSGRTGVPLFIGRISNLYGPGQDIRKSQGLITLLCRAQLTRQPLNIYVSLDTMRDFLFVDDAAAMVVAGLAAVGERGGSHTKVLANGRSHTIGAVIGELRRISRRRPPVAFGVSEQARFQVRDLRLGTVAWPPLSSHARTTLIAGMGATMAALANQFRTATDPRRQ